jgi:hypothetical protein
MENLCERPLAGSRMSLEKALDIGHDLVHAGEVEDASFGHRTMSPGILPILAAQAFRSLAHSPQDNDFSNQGYPSVWRIASRLRRRISNSERFSSGAGMYWKEI